MLIAGGRYKKNLTLSDYSRGLRHCTLVSAAHCNVLWLLTSGGTYNTLNRYRMALIGLLAVATALEMWAANIALNLAGQ